MLKLSRAELGVITAYEKGYRVLSDGSVSGIRKNKLKLHFTNKESLPYYYRFSVQGYDKKKHKVLVHQLVAYQKFKNAIFEESIQVRHLDGDSLNNTPGNITIGSPTDNQYDKLPETRLAHSIMASTYNRKFSDNEMVSIRKFHSEAGSYKNTMKTFHITSKGTLHYILNNKYQTKV